MIARRMGMLAVATLLGLPGCRTKEAPPPATPPDEPEASGTIEPLTFAWPRPARARVVERIFRKERHAVTEYFLVIEDEPDGRISVRYADFHFLEVEGLDIEDPKMAHQLEQLEFQMALVLPPMYVNRDGSWSGIGDFEEVMKMLTKMHPGRKVPEGAYNSPTVRRLTDQALAKVWDAWAGNWVGWEVGPGHYLEYDTEMEGGGAMHVLVENEGLDPELPANYRLTLASRVDGESALALVGSILTSLAEESGRSPDEVKRHLESADIVYDYAAGASVNAKTLQPDYAYTSMLTKYTIAGQTAEKVEEHEYYFDWDTDQAGGS